ncbi:MAG: GNAT family N-acetyltransferase [Bacteroidetes bacterium]|nr:GNAT family N-acetyltransferase [Bacteroidota bacterium]MBS1629873.1 GNAT family N-acetyltransferase [Bacteroidota bacterium]
MYWLPHPITLTGSLLRLEPLQEAHLDELTACGAAPIIWEHLPLAAGQPESLRKELGKAILNRLSGTQYPFTIFAKAGNRIIGSTRFFDLLPEHRKLEIGWTWYHPDCWGRGFNLECKLLLLDFAFEKLRLNRVQFKTRDTNLRSQAALEKIGACYEGRLRNDRIMPNGIVRDTLVYSIIREEWPEKKEKLIFLLREKQLQNS